MLKQDKQLMIYNFNHAASKYLQHANIQKEPAEKIYSISKNFFDNNVFALDLGSGPGTLEHITYSNQQIILYDISLSMLKTTFKTLEGIVVNGDAESLPFKNNSFDLLISNLMLQWVYNKQQVLNEASRVLKSGAHFIFTSLINPSLWQLNNIWADIDQYQHSLNFINEEEYIRLCQNAGFKILKQQSWQRTFYFSDYMEILQHFKLTGTSMVKANRQGLGGRVQLNKFGASYEKYRTTMGLPLTYSYILIYGEKM